MITRRGSRPQIVSPQDLDIISAIWMLACTDRDTILTYHGIAYRLRLPGWDALGNSNELAASIKRVKELVKGRAELFSTVVARQWLCDWKDWVIAGRHYPAWVLELPSAERQDAIKNLQVSDVFRCQFRTKDLRKPHVSAWRWPLGLKHSLRDPCTPPCTPDQVKLGLEHIDRLRKAGAEAREERVKFWLPVLTAGVSAFAVLVSWQSVVSSRETARDTIDSSRRATEQAGLLAATEAEIKLWDLAARERGEAYEAWLDAMQSAFDGAKRPKGHSDLQKRLTRMRFSLFRLEPLIDQKADLVAVWRDEESFGISLEGAEISFSGLAGGVRRTAPGNA